MAVQIHPDRPMTVEEFDAWVMLPENADRHLQFVGGAIIEVVSNHQSSGIGLLIGAYLTLFIKMHRLGLTTGTDGGYMVAGERYMPDFAYVSYAKQKKFSKDSWFPFAPDLAVEVLSPSNTALEMRTKVSNYLSAGTVLWIVDADKRRIEIYEPGQPIRVVRMGETLDGGALLPGFTLAVSDLFADVD
jgi:Uma2 family endonuclease